MRSNRPVPYLVDPKFRKLSTNALPQRKREFRLILIVLSSVQCGFLGGVDCPNLKVDVNVKATAFPIVDRWHKTLISIAEDVGWWIEKASAIAALLTKLR